MERRDSGRRQGVVGRMKSAAARVDAVVYSYFDRRARERKGQHENLASARMREIRNKFRRSDKLGPTADLLRWAATKSVVRHERRQGMDSRGLK